ncbi:hypothetical protein DVH24_041374 [Malus domestica]|uniref:BURP domain-containing protein n=1 Tax=Malus domestica TaxID=3750 RepID=A0A498IDX6_MALDO|nr:hypothetical protein DVH24_041374 [Malus domestica]
MLSLCMTALVQTPLVANLTAAAFLNTWDPVPLTLPAYSPLSLLLTAPCRFISFVAQNHRKKPKPQTIKSIFTISLRIGASLSLTASSSTNLNRSRTTSPSGWKTHEEILVVVSADSSFKPSPTLLPKSFLTDLSSNFATAIACEARKPLVIERVKVVPPNAMEMRVKVKIYLISSLGTPLNVAKRKIILSCCLLALL